MFLSLCLLPSGFLSFLAIIIFMAQMAVRSALSFNALFISSSPCRTSVSRLLPKSEVSSPSNTSRWTNRTRRGSSCSIAKMCSPFKNQGRPVLSVLAAGSLDVDLDLGSLFWLAYYLVDKRVPLLVFVKVGEYLPDPLGACVYFDFCTKLFQAYNTSTCICL
jgi:hypothetical protein